jgi:hypothetical protein
VEALVNASSGAQLLVVVNDAVYALNDAVAAASAAGVTAEPRLVEGPPVNALAHPSTRITAAPLKRSWARSARAWSAAWNG